MSTERGGDEATRLPYTGAVVEAELIQKSLFPDAVEVAADALAALEELEVERGFEHVRRARRCDPSLPNLDPVEAALVWLRGVLGDGPADRERASAAFLALPGAGLSHGATLFADRALARYGLRRASGAFLDARERVHVGALHLVLGHPATARGALCLAGHQERADLWGWRADACALVERDEEASECYARALLLDASRVDLFRLREPRLAELYAELRAAHPEACARELLLPNAWMRGLIPIPPGNEWLAGSVARLRARTVVGRDASQALRLRRFAFLFYLDRSRPPGAAVLEEREEMETLDPGLFRRVLAVLRERER